MLSLFRRIPVSRAFLPSVRFARPCVSSLATEVTSFSYGSDNFEENRDYKEFFADETHMLPVLDAPGFGSRHSLLIRPPRWGKSLLASMSECYFDINQKDKFDRLFKGLFIHENPTEGQGSYYVLAVVSMQKPNVAM
jgi:hypothetical protein